MKLRPPVAQVQTRGPLQQPTTNISSARLVCLDQKHRRGLNTPHILASILLSFTARRPCAAASLFVISHQQRRGHNMHTTHFRPQHHGIVPMKVAPGHFLSLRSFISSRLQVTPLFLSAFCPSFSYLRYKPSLSHSSHLTFMHAWICPDLDHSMHSGVLHPRCSSVEPQIIWLRSLIQCLLQCHGYIAPLPALHLQAWKLVYLLVQHPRNEICPTSDHLHALTRRCHHFLDQSEESNIKKTPQDVHLEVNSYPFRNPMCLRSHERILVASLGSDPTYRLPLATRSDHSDSDARLPLFKIRSKIAVLARAPLPRPLCRPRAGGRTRLRLHL